MDHWNFNDLLHFHMNLPDDFDNFLYNHFHFLDNFLPDHLFSNDLNLPDFNFFMNNFNYFLHDCWHFNNTLYRPNDGHNLFYNTVNWLVDCFNVVAHLKCFAIFDNGYYLFHDALNDLDLGNFNNFLDDSVSENWNFYDFLHDSFYCNNLFFDDLDFLWLLLNMIDNSLHFDDSFNLDNLLDNGGHLNDFCDFLS